MPADLVQSLGSAEPMQIAGRQMQSRLIMGSGRFPSFEVMRDCLDRSGTECVTVAVRRDRLHDGDGRNILDFIDLQRYLVLPNTAGCFDSASAIRVAKLGREILRGLGVSSADWVKLEVLGDSRTLLPHPVETLKATEALVSEGFHVFCYTSDDPVIAMQLKQLGAVAVMPAGSPIGSGQGIANPVNLQIILEQLKADDPNYPVIVDAGLGTASDVTIAMELGADAVLLNTAVAESGNPPLMADAMNHAVVAGREAYLAGRMRKSLYGSASSPQLGTISQKLPK